MFESVNHKVNNFFLTLAMLLAIFPLTFISVSIIPEKLTYETLKLKKKQKNNK